MRIVTEMEKTSPYILTAIDGRAVFMNKDNPFYKPKDNDRVVSLDCVLANEHRLVEITQELGYPSEYGAFELQT